MPTFFQTSIGPVEGRNNGPQKDQAQVKAKFLLASLKRLPSVEQRDHLLARCTA
jgi:hypothetical protein